MIVRWAVGGCNLFPLADLPEHFKRGNKLSNNKNDVAHLQPLANVPTKYQLPTPYHFQDIAQTRFYRSRSLRQGQRSNQGHTMTLHTYTP